MSAELAARATARMEREANKSLGQCPGCDSGDVHVLKSREHPEHDRICLDCMEEWSSL